MSLFQDIRQKSHYLSSMGINPDNLAFFTQRKNHGVEFKFSYKPGTHLTVLHDDLCMLIHRFEMSRTLERGLAFELYQHESVDAPVMYDRGSVTFQPYQNATHLAFGVKDLSGQAFLVWKAQDSQDPLFAQSVQDVYRALILQQPDLEYMTKGKSYCLGRTGKTVDVVLEALENAALLRSGITREYLQCIEDAGENPVSPQFGAKPLIRRMDLG